MGTTEREPSKWVGTEDEPIQVSASEVMDAIADGKRIYVAHVVIEGDLNVDTILGSLKPDGNGSIIIPGLSINDSEIRGNVNFRGITLPRAKFDGTTFSGYAKFMQATFEGYAIFSKAIFIRYANFWEATFNDRANFRESTFDGIADFRDATFSERADFANAKMKYPANFEGIHYHENTVFAGLWNNILQPCVSRLTVGKIRLSNKPVTDFSTINTTSIMDGSSNPWLKRYIDDEQWIASWKKRGKMQRFLFVIWEVMCHCGRSIGLWAFWSISFAGVFGLIYWRSFSNCFGFTNERLLGKTLHVYDYFYYSVVTFTTLGFGDIVPTQPWAKFMVALEVVIGYVMLGGLISIFANKLARRS